MNKFEWQKMNNGGVGNMGKESDSLKEIGSVDSEIPLWVNFIDNVLLESLLCDYCSYITRKNLQGFIVI